MAPVAHCLFCGEAVPDADDRFEVLPLCQACLEEAQLGELDEPFSDDAEFGGDGVPLSHSRAHDQFLTRSMVIPFSTPASLAPPGATRSEEMIARVDPDSLRWLQVSENLREFLGHAVSRLLVRSFLDSVHPDDRQLARTEFDQVLDFGERNDIVIRLKSQSNQWHYMRLTAQARYEPDGTINHIRCNFRDVTDRVQAEQELKRRTEQLLDANEQLRQANQQLEQAQAQLVHSEKLAALGTLAAGMAHELNNPLAFVINNLAIIERDLEPLFRLVALEREGEAEIAKSRPDLAAAIATLADELDLNFLQESLPRLVKSSHNGLKRVARIVEKLRGFAQLDRAKISDFDINESLDECLLMLGESLSHAQIVTERDLAPIPTIPASAVDLNQVFLDILANAISAIECTGRTDGRIVVKSDQVADHVVVEVTDNGCGIDPAILPKIFDPFFTTKPQGKGVGLGLSLCHGIVAHHGGKIHVESQPGQGTCFRVSLPVDPDDRPAR
jgi:PAS domain S-box-containing protein